MTGTRARRRLSLGGTDLPQWTDLGQVCLLRSPSEALNDDPPR